MFTESQLNKSTREFIAGLPEDSKSIISMTIDEFRCMQVELNEQFAGPVPESVEILEETVSGQPVRIYRPEDYSSATMPTLLYVPGGAFVTSGFLNKAPMRMASKAQVIVISHRLAPEFRIKDCVGDVAKAMLRLLSNCEKYEIGEQVFAGGDSSGASFLLAAMLQLHNHQPDVFGVISGLVLISPAVDLTMAPDKLQQFDNQDALFSLDAVKAVQGWLRHENLEDPVVSPIYAESIASFPPTSIIIPQCDRLRSHAAALEEKLIGDHVPCRVIILPGQVHASLNFRGVLSEGRDPAAEVVACLSARCETRPQCRL